MQLANTYLSAIFPSSVSPFPPPVELSHHVLDIPEGKSEQLGVWTRERRVGFEEVEVDR